METQDSTNDTSDSVENLIGRGYDAGFITAIESDTLPPGLNEDVVRTTSARKKRAGLDVRKTPGSLRSLAKHD